MNSLLDSASLFVGIFNIGISYELITGTFKYPDLTTTPRKIVNVTLALTLGTLSGYCLLETFKHNALKNI